MNSGAVDWKSIAANDTGSSFDFPRGVAGRSRVPLSFDGGRELRGQRELFVLASREANDVRVIRVFRQNWFRNDVQRVHYPGLKSHAQHDLARRQMQAFGGMVSVVFKGGETRARRFLEGCQLFTLAESLGGVESLIEHPGLMTHASIPAAKRAEIGIDDGLVRLSVGVEDVSDLLADLEQALRLAS